jgi:polyhydroxybutyrate depolymerase
MPQGQRYLIRLVLGVVMAAAGWASDVHGRTVFRTLFVDGQLRGYYEHVPDAYDGTTPVPLVLMLHGRGGSGLVFETITGFSAKADQEGFIVIYPNALGNPRAWNTSWSPGSGYDPQIDIDFLTALLDTLETRLNIDPSRIYVGGQSSGACMSYLIGSTLSDRIAAIGDVGGAVGSTIEFQHLEAPPPDQPVSTVIFHGLQDDLVPYFGGAGSDFPHIHWRSVLYSALFWVSADGCALFPQTDTSDDGNIIRDTFTDGAAGTEVVVYTIVDGSHPWPPVTTLAVTDEMWNFFVNHPKQ